MSYNKGKLEEAYRSGGILEKPVKHSKEAHSAKREDIDLIVSFLSFKQMPRNQQLQRYMN